VRTTFAFSAIVLAFIAGVAVTWIAPTADAQTPAPAALRPQVIHIADMKDEEIGPFINSTDLRDLRSRTLVATHYGTIAVQSGNVPKHFHADANEIQIIVEGSGSFWLGENELQVKPGDFIIIPKGVPHAGSQAAVGRFRSIAIKLPPQQSGDVHPAP
jgi:mannose-6-phosphate isomerase-like protein (cupin superfamily)